MGMMGLVLSCDDRSRLFIACISGRWESGFKAGVWGVLELATGY